MAANPVLESIPSGLPSPPLPAAAQYGLALLSGALLVLCFPGADQGWIAWLALVPLFVALQSSGLAGSGLRSGRAIGLGFVAGAVFLGGLLYWIWIFGWYAWLALTVFQALWIAFFGAVAAVLLRRAPPNLGPLALAAGWTTVEWLRSLGVLGLTWGDLAVSQHGTLPVLQMLEWTGPWGLTFLIALFNAAVAYLLLARRLPAGWRLEAARQGARWVTGAALIVVPLTARGAWVLSQGPHADARPGTAAALPVAVVQGNIDQDVSWDAGYQRQALEAHARLTLAAARAGARLVVWPETSLPGELRYDPALRAAVTQLARVSGTELIVGSNDHEGQLEYNQAFLVDREGRLRGGYAKRHLVPFGETVPMRAWFPFLENLHVRPLNLTPGAGFYPLRGDHALGTLICFESAFPGISRAMARGGAEILLEITDDTWFGRTAAAAQHAAMAPLRAVETRRALARATTTGISTLVDEHGRVRHRLGLFREGYLLERLPLRRDLTLCARLGDWPVYLCLLFCLVVLARPSAWRIKAMRSSSFEG